MGFFDRFIHFGDKTKQNLSRAERHVWSRNSDRATKALEQKMEQIFAAYFPEYEVKTNISPETIGGTGKFVCYNYGLYRFDQPRIFIMTVAHNGDMIREYRWSREQAARMGIPCVTFRSQFPNEESYVVNRLRSFL